MFTWSVFLCDRAFTPITSICSICSYMYMNMWNSSVQIPHQSSEWITFDVLCYENGVQCAWWNWKSVIENLDKGMTFSKRWSPCRLERLYSNHKGSNVIRAINGIVFSRQLLSLCPTKAYGCHRKRSRTRDPPLWATGEAVRASLVGPAYPCITWPAIHSNGLLLSILTFPRPNRPMWQVHVPYICHMI